MKHKGRGFKQCFPGRSERLDVHRGGRNGLDGVAVAGVPAETVRNDAADLGVELIGHQDRIHLTGGVGGNGHQLAVIGHETDHVADDVVILRHHGGAERIQHASEASVENRHVQVLGGLERDDLTIAVHLDAIGRREDNRRLLVDDAHGKIMDLDVRLDRAPVRDVPFLQLAELQSGANRLGIHEGGQLDAAVLETDELNLAGGDVVDPGDLGHVAGVEVHQIVSPVQALADGEEPVARVTGDRIHRETIPVDGREQVADEVRADLTDDGEAGDIAHARVAEAIEADHTGSLHLDHQRDLILADEREARGVGAGVLDVDTGEATKRGLGKGAENGADLVEVVAVLAVHEKSPIVVTFSRPRVVGKTPDSCSSLLRTLPYSIFK